MFENCVINEINFTNFNTTLITNMANLFNGCSKLISLDLSNFNTSSVTSMENMFSNMKLKSLYLSNFNTSSVTTMKNMFNKSDSLKILDISNLIIGENCDTENMFLNLPNLIYTVFYVVVEYSLSWNIRKYSTTMFWNNFNIIIKLNIKYIYIKEFKAFFI